MNFQAKCDAVELPTLIYPRSYSTWVVSFQLDKDWCRLGLISNSNLMLQLGHTSV